MKRKFNSDGEPISTKQNNHFSNQLTEHKTMSSLLYRIFASDLLKFLH